MDCFVMTRHCNISCLAIAVIITKCVTASFLHQRFDQDMQAKIFLLILYLGHTIFPKIQIVSKLTRMVNESKDADKKISCMYLKALNTL